MVFIRYWSFVNVPQKEIDQGRWPIIANAVFNAFSHYLFITGFVLIFLPIFIGKLSIVRDIFASSFFRPLARVSFSALIIHGLVLFLVFFSHEQSIYFDHKNMIFIYFSLIFFTYIIALFVALFLEYPFRTMAKVVFSPPKKILRLNRELAKELNTNIDNLFNDSDGDDGEEGDMMDQVVEAQQQEEEEIMAKAGVRISAQKEAQYVMPTLDLSTGTFGKIDGHNSGRATSGDVVGNNSKTRLSREV